MKASTQDLPLVSPQGSPVAVWCRGKNGESSPQISVGNIRGDSVSLLRDQKGDQMPQRLLPDVTLSLSDVKKSFQGCDRDNRFLCTLVLPTQG